MQRLRANWFPITMLILGPAFIAVGFVMNIQANIGQGPWQAFHVGISLNTPLSVGVAGQVVSVIIMAVAWGSGVRPGWGTLFNIALVGVYTDLLLWNNVVPEMHDPISGFVMMLVGALIMALGTALYVKAGIGNGPRDSLMVGLSRRMDRDVGPIRIVMDGLALLFGWLLGAPIGFGTVAFVVILGPALTVWFRVLGVRSGKSLGKKSSGQSATTQDLVAQS